MKHEMDYYEKMDMEYPKSPSKPLLSRSANSVEAFEYATKLAKYEDDLVEHRKRMSEYINVSNQRFEEFKEEVIAENNMTNHPNVEAFWTKAWDLGHASGLERVREEFCDLVRLMS